MKILFILGFTAVSLLVISPAKSKSLGAINTYFPINHSVVKIKAFEILKTKCNICHTKKNRKKIFTLENMDIFAAKVEEQVFIKKRMPRGKKNKLTDKEYQQLSTWIKSLKQ